MGKPRPDASGVPELRQRLEVAVFLSLQQLCGGEGLGCTDNDAALAWDAAAAAAVRALVASTVSRTGPPGAEAELQGRPWDLEVRTAVSYFHRYRSPTSGALEVVSDLGLRRSFHSAPEFAAALLVLALEPRCREDNNAGLGGCELGCGPAGILRVTTPARRDALRAAGRLPCRHCGDWFRGAQGLWWHTQQQHRLEHGGAVAAAVGAGTAGAMIVYDAAAARPFHCPSSMPNTKGNAAAAAPSATEVAEDDPVRIAREGDLPALHRLAAAGFDAAAYVDRRGAGLLLWAAGAGQLPMLRCLVREHGCDPRTSVQASGRRGFRGRTALHWAARNGHLPVVRHLLEEERVDADAGTADGTTAFCWAAWQGHQHVLEYLHRRGCRVGTVNAFGCNAALWAAQGHGSADVLRWLDAVGCDCLVLNENRHGVLHKAAQRGRRELCDWFLQQKVLHAATDPSVALSMVGPDTEGCLPSDLAGMEGHDSLAQYLAEKERVILEKFLGSLCAKLPPWLQTAPGPSGGEHLWEPWAGVRRLRSTMERRKQMCPTTYRLH